MKVQVVQNVSKLDYLLAVPYYVKLLVKFNTVKTENESLKLDNASIKNLIKSDLYKDFMAKIEAPHKIIDLQNSLKIRTQQRNDLRVENLKQREELKKQKEYVKDYDLVVKQRDKYKKQVKSLKDIIKSEK